MLQGLKDVFFDAAERHQCWIGLREPNPLAERWIGRSGYTPKMEACKAKTADNSRHEFAGLVVDPILCKNAFKPETVKAAQETWKNKFLKGDMLPVGFTRDTKGSQKGLVKYNGQAIYADFDLMAVNRSNENGDFVPTTLQEETDLFNAIAPLLNKGFGSQMIQHGAEFMWEGGVGARESEYVYWFGPGRRFQVGTSSMPKAGH